jgi:hypothetical protein
MITIASDTNIFLPTQHVNISHTQFEKTRQPEMMTSSAEPSWPPPIDKHTEKGGRVG